MADIKLTIESFSVSYALDITKPGERSSHFLNATFKVDPGISLEEFTEQHLMAGKKVCLGVIQHAVVRQAMTVDEGRERMREIEENYSNFMEAARKKRLAPET